MHRHGSAGARHGDLRKACACSTSAPLAPLFRQTGISYERTNDTLTFHKNQAAQDKMSVFDGRVLQIGKNSAGSIEAGGKSGKTPEAPKSAA